MFVSLEEFFISERPKNWNFDYLSNIGRNDIVRIAVWVRKFINDYKFIIRHAVNEILYPNVDSTVCNIRITIPINH